MEGGRPDILIEEASGWPIDIEAERSNHASAEADAQARLGRTVASTGRQIETAIALVYPANLHSLDGSALRYAISSTQDLEYALYTRRVDSPPERLPSQGWIPGNPAGAGTCPRQKATNPDTVVAPPYPCLPGGCTGWGGDIRRLPVQGVARQTGTTVCQKRGPHDRAQPSPAPHDASARPSPALRWAARRR